MENDSIEYWTEMLEHVMTAMDEIRNSWEDNTALTVREEISLRVLMTQASMYTARLRTAVENEKNQPKKKFWQR